MKVIETKNLTKYYGKSRGILDLNLEVEEGDIFGFIGPNGAGKSTTIRTLLGLISASSGEGTVFGMDIHTETKNILNRVGYMPGEANFYQSIVTGAILFLRDLGGARDFLPNIGLRIAKILLHI